MTEQQKLLLALHGVLVAELKIVKYQHSQLGVAISDLRGQLDTIFEGLGVEVPNKKYEYLGFRTTAVK